MGAAKRRAHVQCACIETKFGQPLFASVSLDYEGQSQCIALH